MRAITPGFLHFYLGDYKKSEDYLKQAARVSDRNVLYYLVRMALANLYSATGKPEDAIRTLNEAIASNKDYVPSSDLLLQLAGIYKNAGKNKEAQDTYQKIVNEYKDSPASFQAQNELDELKNK